MITHFSLDNTGMYMVETVARLQSSRGTPWHSHPRSSEGRKQKRSNNTEYGTRLGSARKRVVCTIPTAHDC